MFSAQLHRAATACLPKVGHGECSMCWRLLDSAGWSKSSTLLLQSNVPAGQTRGYWRSRMQERPNRRPLVVCVQAAFPCLL